MGELERNAGLEVVEQQDPNWGGHPLFPRPDTETGPDRRRFDLIHIHRTRHDGTKEICPRAWKGSELRSWQQIADAYGGGTYQLSAQCGQSFRFQAYSEKVQIGGKEKPFREDEPAPPIAPLPPANAAPAIAAPAPSPPPAPPAGFAPSYPFPPHYPPPSNGGEQTAAIVRAMGEMAASSQATLLRVLLDRSASKEGTSPLEVLREILPLMNNGGAAHGTQALLQGVELAKGLISQNGQPAPAAPAAPQEDELAMVGQVLRLIAPNHPPPAPAPAPVAAPAAPPGAMLAPPPAAPPPGWAWAFTAAGWALVPLAQVQPYAAPAPPPAPAAPPQSPEPARVDVESALAALLADPERLERVRAAIKAPAPAPSPPAQTQPQPQPPEPATKAPEPAPAEGSASPNPAPLDLVGGAIEAALANGDVSKLFQSLTGGVA